MSYKKRNTTSLDKQRSGFSLIEILVVITLFSIVAMLSTQAVVLSLRGARKSEAQAKVRESLSHAMDVMERQIRNAESVSCTSGGKKIDYVDTEKNNSYFECVSSGTTGGFIASGSGSVRLTPETVGMTCQFTCSSTYPTSIDIVLTGDNAKTSGEGTQIIVNSKVQTRAY